MSCESDAIYTIAVIGSSSAEENELEKCRKLGVLLGERISKLSQQCRVLLQWGACGGAPFAVLKTLADMELPNVQIVGYQPYVTSGERPLYDDDPDMSWCEIKPVVIGDNGDRKEMHLRQAGQILENADVVVVLGGRETTGMEVREALKSDKRVVGLIGLQRGWGDNENEAGQVQFFENIEEVVKALLVAPAGCGKDDRIRDDRDVFAYQ